MLSWAEAYNKACKLVSQMTLVEKGMFIPCQCFFLKKKEKENTKYLIFFQSISPPALVGKWVFA